ncbi:MAG: zinc-dependent alcohol dehydrogenase family protein [archaeon]|nr:zinc-dependent alcohol dehydrogenase family protein [archaeon]MCP8306893.1 zinc-dependent alcohol dehydrogenase family protein [archaeon]
MLLDRLGPIESKPLKSSSLNNPVIDEEEILVRVRACGVCRSNLHMIEGDWVGRNIPSKLPIIPGHEIVGVIESTGRDVIGLKIGDRVGIQPLYHACGVCEYCLTGRENICPSRKITGQDVDGGYAEYIKIPFRFVYKVPDRLSDSEAAPLFCPGVTAYRAVKYSNAAPGKIVAIFGIGGVGHVALQIAKLWGAKVVAVSRNERHLELASRLGAHSVISPEEDIVRYFRGIGYADSSIVFAPSDKAINQAVNVTKPGGITILGVSGNIRNFQYFKEKTIKGTIIGSRQDMREVLEIAADGKIHTTVETYGLEEANEALRRLKYSEIEGRAVLIP